MLGHPQTPRGHGTIAIRCSTRRRLTGRRRCASTTLHNTTRFQVPTNPTLYRLLHPNMISVQRVTLPAGEFTQRLSAWRLKTPSTPHE